MVEDLSFSFSLSEEGRWRENKECGKNRDKGGEREEEIDMGSNGGRKEGRGE